MDYIVDTNAVLNFILKSGKLPKKVKSIIKDNDNRIYVCIVSLWEIGIKNSIGKLHLECSLDDFFKLVNDSEFIILPIKQEYITHLPNLSLIHRDPFDRIITATAIVENMTLITSDKDIQKYKIKWVW
jgi:PIN domain nuclease of toxin-antitoxin system